MPAYFSIEFQFRRSCLRPNLVWDFCSIMGAAGFPFLRGCYEAESMQLQEIAQYNQQKLEENFELGFTETRENDYKQAYFNRPDYHEVRGFWVNMPEASEFYFCLIIPESDIVHCERTCWYFQREKLEPVIRLAETMWDLMEIDAVQTGLELDDTVMLEDLAKGEEPCAVPFAVVSNQFPAVGYIKKYAAHSMEREGLFLLNETLVRNATE